MLPSQRQILGYAPTCSLDPPALGPYTRWRVQRDASEAAGTSRSPDPPIVVSGRRRARLSVASAPTLQMRLELPQQRIDGEADDADRDHAGNHDRGADAGLTLHQHISDAARSDDQFGANERLPAQAGAHA